jgi:hypothetical protein
VAYGGGYSPQRSGRGALTGFVADIAPGSGGRVVIDWGRNAEGVTGSCGSDCARLARDSWRLFLRVRFRQRKVAHNSFEAFAIGIVVFPVAEIANMASAYGGGPRFGRILDGIVKADGK